MTRGVRVASIAVFALAATLAVAQQERDAYRAAYRAWRLADPNLERDAASGGAAVGARADKTAAEAGRYYTARKAYLEAQRAGAEQKASAIEPQPAPAQFDSAPANYAASQSAIIASSIATIANDPDRVIQQLRQSLERERSALTALTAALNDVQKGREAVERSSAATEEARVRLTEHYQAIAAGLQQSALQTAEAQTLWAGYYRALSDAAREAVPREPAPLTAPVRAPAPLGNLPPVQRTPTVTSLPLSRYMGEWNYPTTGAQYHGNQPTFVDLVVSEENGRAKGTLFARFLLPQGGPVEPTLRFDFEGALQKTRNQSFPLVTSGGAKGVIELIPGPAFNLLEVSFSTDGKPSTVRQGNFLLIKK